jgi:TRAP-type mannitol/chloroaromatic compound transport system permease small subunit
MKLTNLKPASDYEVEKWLEKAFDLTAYQKQKLRQEETVRFAPFNFYKRRNKEKVSILWRLTIFLVPIYILLVFLFMPIKMIFTGAWGYGQKFYDNFHARWMNKLNL